MTRYRLTAKAKADLRSIWSYIAADNIEAADRVEKAIYDVCSFLAKAPLRGHLRQDLTKLPVRFWTVLRYPKYVIVYDPEGKPVKIVRIFHEPGTLLGSWRASVKPAHWRRHFQLHLARHLQGIGSSTCRDQPRHQTEEKVRSGPEGIRMEGVIMTAKKKDALDQLIDRFVGNDPERKAMLDEEIVDVEAAQLVYDLRTNAGLSQRKLAKKVGTTASVICRMEQADHEGSLPMLRQIAGALNRRLELRAVPIKPRTTRKIAKAG